MKLKSQRFNKEKGRKIKEDFIKITRRRWRKSKNDNLINIRTRKNRTLEGRL